MSLLKAGDSLSPINLSLKKGRKAPLFFKFKRFVRDHALLESGASVIVAVSGGPDSICLLSLLYNFALEYNLKLLVAHVDHMLRGKESAFEAEFVERVCKQNEIPFFIKRVDVKNFMMSNKGLSVQEACRKLRYEFFFELKREQEIDLIATGHTASDQAEEVLFRLIRGASLEGISGIRPKRKDGVIRPILFAKREEILEFLEDLDLHYVIDSSNLEEKYTRNKLRLWLIKEIQREFNPSLTDTLLRTSLLLQEDEDLLTLLAEKVLVKCEKRLSVSGVFALDIPSLLKKHPSIRRRIYKMILFDLGLHGGNLLIDHFLKIDSLSQAKRPSSIYYLPQGFIVLREYNTLFFLKKDEINSIERGIEIRIDAPQKIELGRDIGSLTIKKVKIHNSSIFKEKGRGLFISRDALKFPIFIRQRRPGDRFQPLGLKESIRLKKFFINRKVPRILRDFIPLIVDEHGDILAICNIEVSDGAKVKDKDAYFIYWEPSPLLKGLWQGAT